MTSFELSSTFLAISFVPVAAFFGALGSKLVTINCKTKWKWAFYSLGFISIVCAVIDFCIVYSSIKAIDYIALFIFIIFGIILLIFTYTFLDIKYIYKTCELDPIINEFTESSDKSEIKLFGGDLNFFGNSTTEMDNNVQFCFLKSLNFKKTLILCEEPRDSSTQIRYGKILHEVNGVELRFYNPEKADLLIRGRMKTIQGVEKLLIYTKIASGQYQTIETDTANSNGALHNNIWKLVWSLATKLNPEQISEYQSLYTGI